jgi:hypothetical protein
LVSQSLDRRIYGGFVRFSVRQTGATDFDGDGKTDVAVYRSGVWCAPCGADNSFFAVAFGAGEDVSVPNGYFAE